MNIETQVTGFTTKSFFKKLDLGHCIVIKTNSTAIWFEIPGWRDLMLKWRSNGLASHFIYTKWCTYGIFIAIGHWNYAIQMNYIGYNSQQQNAIKPIWTNAALVIIIGWERYIRNYYNNWGTNYINYTS